MPTIPLAEPDEAQHPAATAMGSFIAPSESLGKIIFATTTQMRRPSY